MTSAVPCTGFTRKSFYLLSDQSGTLLIEIDPAGLEQWNVLHEGKVTENRFWSHSISDAFDRVRLRFLPTKKGKASAWLVLEK